MSPGVRVWDLPVRLFHWAIVLLIALLWYTGEAGGLDLDLPLPGGGRLYLANMDLHMLAGQTLLALVVFRILWGFLGSATARFGDFLRHPREVLGYLRALFRGELPASVGHNPGGGLMVLLMLLLLLTQALLGLFASDDLFSEGPLAHLVGAELSGRLTTLHGGLFNAILAAIALHLLAVGYYLVRGKNLIGAMITGRKPAGSVPAGTEAQLRIASLWLALVLALLSGLLVWSLRWL